MRKVLLFLIISLALFLRVYRIASFPAGFNLDEISQGYTAYSLLKTGRDEWGKWLPIFPRAFGDYRSPLYTYFLVPSIAVLGLNETAVRLPAAVVGGLAVWATYLLVAEIFKDKKLALLSAFFLAISPWHISLSRGAFEASLNVFFYPLGLWLFLKGKGHWPYFVASGLVLGLNLFSYYSPRFFTPISVALLIFFYRKEFFRSRRHNLFLLTFGFFLLMSGYTLLAGGKTRVADTGIFNPAGGWRAVAERQYEAVWYHFPAWGVKVFNNKVLFLANGFFRQYLYYLSPPFLFLDGAGESTYGMIPGRGILYLFELPLILVALWRTVKAKDGRWLLLLALLLLSPIPASLAKGDRAANRAITMLTFWPIFSAAGALYFLKSRLVSFKIFLSLLLSVSALSLGFFLEDYFYHAPRHNAPYMAYGWREAGEYLRSNLGRFDRVVISKEFSEPQIALAFFLKLDPRSVQLASPDWLDYEKKGYLFVDQLPKYSLGQFEFRNFNFPEDAGSPRSLFVGRERDFAGTNGNIGKVIYYPGPERKVAFMMVSFIQ